MERRFQKACTYNKNNYLISFLNVPKNYISILAVKTGRNVIISYNSLSELALIAISQFIIMFFGYSFPVVKKLVSVCAFVGLMSVKYPLTILTIFYQLTWEVLVLWEIIICFSLIMLENFSKKVYDNKLSLFFMWY